MYDVWASHLMGNSLALGKFQNRVYLPPKMYVTTFPLGMHGKGILISDVNASAGFRALNTSSDVFAIHQEPVG